MSDLYAAVFEQQQGPPFQARHHLTSAQYQQTFNEMAGQGFRPTIVNGYQADGQDFFAAVFEQRQGPPFQARHDLTSAQYQQTFNEMAGQGFRPTVVSGYQSDGQDLFAAVFEQRQGPPFQARHDLTSDQYQQTISELVGQGFRPTVVNGYPLGGQVRFAAVFEQRQGPAFLARHNLTSAQYQQTFDEMVSRGFRPTVVSGYLAGGQDRFAAVFEQRQGPPFQARHNLSSGQYQQTFNEMVGAGFRPTVVCGYSSP